MNLRSGMRLGPYEIVAPIGAGGMGEVYKATDTRLGRTVAIKILPADFASDSKLKIRFEREAKVISSLSHPHICGLFDVGENYLVMEHCEGQTLAERLERGPLPIEKVVEYGAQIAEALNRAHRSGIIHRDLKPSNVMLTESGVKLLDFGLAKPVEEVGGGAANTTTVQRPATEEGHIVGTVQYMAPELLSGWPPTTASDIFALGCVLYEMASGKPAFSGNSRATLIAAILEREPAALGDALPPLDGVIRACLRKNPEERFHSAHDVKVHLRALLEPAANQVRRRLITKFTIGTVAVVAVVMLLALYAMVPSRVEEAGPSRATFTRLTDAAGVEQSPTISPDGTFVAYEASPGGNADIYLQRVGGAKAINLTAGSTADDRTPAFSPDGKLIAFRSERDGGGLFVMGATGESVRRVTAVGFDPAWSPDGKHLAFATQPSSGPHGPRGEVWRVDIATGRTQRVDGDGLTPSWSSTGDRIVFYRARPGLILAVPAAGGQPKVLVQSRSTDWKPVWSGDGRFVYFCSNRSGTFNVWRIAVNEKGETIGQPEPVSTPAGWSEPTSISADGRRIAYCARELKANLQRVSFDPDRERVVGTAVDVTTGNKDIAAADLSPDGNWITFHTPHEQQDIYVVRSDGTEMRKLTDDADSDLNPRWAPDGSRIAFGSKRPARRSRPSTPYQIWVINADGSGLEQLTDVEGAGFPRWTPDGRAMAFHTTKACPSGLCMVDLTQPLPATRVEEVPVFRAGYDMVSTAWSPDGKWLAGTVWPRGVAARALPFVYSRQERKYSAFDFPINGGASARWMSDSRRILLFDAGKLYVLDRAAGTVRLVHSFPFRAGGLLVSSDDRTLYFRRGTGEADVWIADLH